MYRIQHHNFGNYFLLMDMNIVSIDLLVQAEVVFVSNSKEFPLVLFLFFCIFRYCT